MVSTTELESAVAVLRRFGARRILLFGSAVTRPESANDIDLACAGIPPQSYYAAVGALITKLKREVDLVDLDESPRRAAIIEKSGKG